MSPEPVKTSKIWKIIYIVFLLNIKTKNNMLNGIKKITNHEANVLIFHSAIVVDDPFPYHSETGRVFGKNRKINRKQADSVKV